MPRHASILTQSWPAGFRACPCAQASPRLLARWTSPSRRNDLHELQTRRLQRASQLCLCRSGAACQWRASWLSAALDELAVSCPRRRQQQASCTHHQPTPPRCENDGLQMRAGAACRVLLISQRCSSGSSSLVFRQSTPEPVGGCSWCS